MIKQKKKKKRLKFKRLFLLLLFLAVISFVCIKFVDIPIMNITIKGNEILSDQEIIEQAKLENYPSFFSTFSFKVKQELMKNPYINEAKVYKGILNVKIEVKENTVLYIDKETNEKVTENSKIKDDKIVCAPFLINEVPNDKKDGFIKALKKIDKDILCQMSQIKYDPNEIDKDRYYVYMNDGNGVYLTVNKFNKINKYNDILESIGKQNGILYLDYGDYFEVK